MEPELKIVVVDDHPLFREGVVHILMSHGIDVVGEGATAEEAARLTALHEPDIVLLDVKLPGGGLSAIKAILETQSHAGILMLTVVDDEECVTSALRTGARGYLLKGAGGNELVEAVRTVARGDLYIAPQLVGMLVGRLSNGQGEHREPVIEFTEREEQVLTLLSRGLSNKEIAFRLELSEKTIKYYLTHVLKKLHVRNRVEAALYASHRAGITGARALR